MCFMALMLYILLICVIDLFPNTILKKSYDGLNYIREIAIPSNRVNKSKPLRMTSKIYSDVNYKQKNEIFNTRPANSSFNYSHSSTLLMR